MINCDFEFITYKLKCIGIWIDLSNSIERCISALEAITTKKANSLYLYSEKSKKPIRISMGEKNICLEESYDLILPSSDIEVIKCLLLDVFLNNGFPGYHYDLDITNKNYDVQISFVLQK